LLEKLLSQDASFFFFFGTFALGFKASLGLLLLGLELLIEGLFLCI